MTFDTTGRAGRITDERSHETDKNIHLSLKFWEYQLFLFLSEKSGFDIKRT